MIFLVLAGWRLDTAFALPKPFLIHFVEKYPQRKGVRPDPVPNHFRLHVTYKSDDVTPYILIF